ncbi:MAG TPA: hypothetical protein VI981_00030 [Candidatus Paceibacterota bacterium]
MENLYLKAIRLGNPTSEEFASLQLALDEGESDDFFRDDVLEIVGSFVQSSLRISFDPLAHLRLIFPLYEWGSYDVIEGKRGASSEVLREFRDLIQSADFFWPAACTADDWVIARRKDRVGKGLSLCGSKELLASVTLMSESQESSVSNLARMLEDPAALFNKVLKDQADI